MRPRYSGPFLIVDRPSDSTIQIKTGNYVSGRARLELHSWARCKPAYLRSGAEEGSRPKLGRPSKIDTSPDPSLVQTKQVNRHPRAKASGDKARGWRPWEVTSEHSASIS